MGKFVNVDSSIEKVNSNLESASKGIEDVKNLMTSDSAEIEELEARLSKIQASLGIPIDTSSNNHNNQENTCINELNDIIDSKLAILTKTVRDKKYDLKWHDYIVATIAGGLAISVDFLIVKTPKTVSLGKGRGTTKMEGSPLTTYLRTLGENAEGKKWAWIKWLEDNCKVPYDKSIDSLVEGLCPAFHRLHSVAHDSSLAGLLWAIKDFVCGTFTTIDKKGVLRVEKIGEGEGMIGLLVAPVIWLGHIISDVFTSAGIPIPGWTYLQMLQFGSFGEKKRTIADLSRYMYYCGYDLRHLVTMSATKVIIQFVVRLYHFLVNVHPEEMTQQVLLCEKEYGKVKNNIMLHRMLFVSNSIAAAGNVAKIAVYQGNPLSINIVIWNDFIKEAIAQAKIENRMTRDFEKSIELRHTIDKQFEILSEK